MEAEKPLPPAPFAWAPLVVVHAVAFVGATLVVAHQAHARHFAGIFGLDPDKGNIQSLCLDSKVETVHI